MVFSLVLNVFSRPKGQNMCVQCFISIILWIINHPADNKIQRTRVGVEDARLEANPKDTKKILGQGQEQPFRGQTFSRPRTGILEAKDQGHKRRCSPKKKGLHKFFFRRSTKF